VLVALSGVLGDIGELRRAEALALEALDSSRDPRMAARARMLLWEIRSASENTTGWREEALREARDALSVFAASGDELGMASARYLEAIVYDYDYRFADADAALEDALEHARRAGDESEEMKINDMYARSSLWGPVHVDSALQRYRDFLERFRGNRVVEANCLRGMAMLKAMQGRFDEARRFLARSSACLRDLGLTLGATTSLAPGNVELLAGDAEAAERAFRSSYEGLERAGERNTRANAAAYLARALYEQGRYDDAVRFTRVSEELAPDDDFATMVEWASTRAKVLARRGRAEDADRLSREAVRRSAATDELVSRGNALLDRAETLRLVGRPAEGLPCVREALALFDRKGDVASAARARRMLEAEPAERIIDLREEEPSRR
jgi:tetratricopeptide (TPR) repeat protein